MISSSGKGMKLWRNPSCLEIFSNLNKCKNLNSVELNWNYAIPKLTGNIE